MRVITLAAACLALLIPAGCSNSCTLPPSPTATSSHDLHLSQSIDAVHQSIAALKLAWANEGGQVYKLDLKSSTAIGNSLERYQLKQWGFVIFRCTYSSQTKWDKFVSLIKQGARDYFERWDTEALSIYDKMTWTIIEDAEALHGASILDTSRRFRDWVGAVGREEMQGSTFTDTWYSSPRYDFFIHVDEESLESVVDDKKARQASEYFCTVVRKDMVFMREESRRAGEIPDDLDPGDEYVELLDLRKKVKLGELVNLYAVLLSSDSWYDIYVDLDVGVVDILPGPSQFWAS